MSSSSDDDQPLARRKQVNGSPKANGSKPILSDSIPASLDRQLDEEMDVDSVGGEPVGAISVVNKKIVKVEPGASTGRKRRVAAKAAIKEESDSENDDAPLSKRRKPNGVKKAAPVKDSDDDVPLAKKSRAAIRTRSPVIKKSPEAAKTNTEEDSDSDIPLVNGRLSPKEVAKFSKEKVRVEREAAKTAKKIRADAATNGKSKATVKKEDKSEAGLKGKKRTVAAKTNGVKKEEFSDDDIPLAKRAKNQAKGKGVKKEETPMVATPADAEEGEDNDEYKWWENQPETDGTVKWETLEHNGVIFPPPYEPLPKNVKMKYNGVDVILAPEAEEVAGFYGALLNSQHATNPKFNANFFQDFTQIVKESGGARNPEGKKIKIASFEKCDFKPIFEYFDAKREEKKKLTPAEKRALKAEKDELEKKYTTCLLNGRKEQVGNFRVEPPGLFRGRGNHPKTGKVKKRVMPEQVTINIGKNAAVPPPPEGHEWAGVINDNTVTWLATWKENINNNTKYVMLAQTSSLKGLSDFKKFEKARNLKGCIDRIRRDYERELKEKSMSIRQRATAMYLIDKLALRAGNEKGEDEADTVGCCSLRLEHVKLIKETSTICFDFLGKDSIRFLQETVVTPQVFKNFVIFRKSPKGPKDMIFDRLSTQDLNKHLQSYMEGLTAKVFRTYNASWTMQQELNKIPNKGSVHDKFAAYQLANKTVAVLCNHQRTVTAGHESSMQKTEEKIKALRYQKLRLKRQILYLHPERKKKNPEFFKPDPEIAEDGWIQEHQQELIEQEKEKITKKFEKENEKLAAEGETEQKANVLAERLEVLKDMKDEFKAENKTGKVEPKSKSTSVDKIESAIVKIDERIRKLEVENQVRDENKTVALGTSKQNYIDPRLTAMFCKKYDVPIEKLFPKTLREKFKWALESADENWEF